MILSTRQVPRPRLMPNRRQASVPRGTEPDALNRRCAMGRMVEHLSTSDRCLYWTTKLAGRECGKNGIGVGTKLGTEPAAHVRRNDANPVGRYVHHRCDVGSDPVRHLMRRVDRQPTVLPMRDRGMRLHGKRRLIRRRVGARQRYRGRGKRAVEISYRAICVIVRLSGFAVRYPCARNSFFKLESSGFLLITDLYQVSRCTSLFQASPQRRRQRLDRDVRSRGPTAERSGSNAQAAQRAASCGAR